MHTDDSPTASLGEADAKRVAGQGASMAPMNGATIDRYRLLQVLGEGGFGVVYEAEQTEPVKRRVALKLIKPGMDSGAVVSRFEAERQALAVMDHPCIAKVLDGGVTSAEQGSRPYFVMELVRGVPITEHCDRNRLRVDERIELFRTVCGAVQHAHAKGVIHRDLKPSNVLVAYDENGEASPKVIDFGIAKALNQQLVEAAVFTEQGQLIGTPEYMSPEQAEMSGQDIDTRADLYSLGVMLYELLTGLLPFDSKSLRAAGYGEIQRIIREVDPPRPSTRLTTEVGSASAAAGHRRTEIKKLSGTLRRDLDWVVMKCLEKDRSRRYETANALAEELRRYLHDEPVLAGPPSAVYRMSKFAKRHGAALVVAGLVAAALAGAAVVSTVFGLNAVRAQADTLAALGERDEALAAERERSDELASVVVFQSDQLASIEPSVMGERMRDAMLAGAPDKARAELAELTREINFTNLATGTLEQSVFARSLEAIRSRFEDQPLVQAELLQTLANTMRELGMLEGAVEPQTHALAIRRRELGESDALTLDSLSWLSTLERMRGHAEVAEGHARAALDGRRKLLGEAHADTLASLNNLGFQLQAQGAYEEGERLIREALEGRQRLLGDEHRSTLTSLANMGIVLSAQGRFAEAEPYYLRAVEGNRRVLGSEAPATLHAVNNLGLLMAQQGKFAVAGELWAEALAGYRAVYGDGHPSTLIAMHNLAKLRMVAGEFDAAETLAIESERRNHERWGARHEQTRDATGLLVQLYQAWHDAEGEHEAELATWRERLAEIERHD